MRLDGLRELSPDVAEALSTFNPQGPSDRLKLNGLRQLSPEAARKLAPFRATLCLGGLRTVSPEVAEALVEVRGRLVLDGVAVSGFFKVERRIEDAFVDMLKLNPPPLP